MDTARLHPAWQTWLAPALESDWYEELVGRVASREAATQIYPPSAHRLRALEMDPLSTRVVILGQDPYHGPGQAMGLSFSVPPSCPVPRSLRNIFKEIEAEGGSPAAGRSGDLTSWASQGVLLLNTILTVEEGTPLAHEGWGWERLTALALQELSLRHPGLVFMLWGGQAQKAAALVDFSKHLRLATSHPSPLSVRRGFQGCGHFSQANDWLVSQGSPPVVW